MRCGWIAVSLVLVVFAGSGALAQNVVVTEIMALNRRGMEDADGSHPDWIELYNPGSAPVDLGGWSLTDNLKDAGKWPFPELTLGPEEFLVVFASEKDRRDPEGELHTNFRLDGQGESVALVDPGGNLVSVIAAYPEQVADASYGRAMTNNRAVLVATGAQARYLVPSDGSLDLTWTEPDFDDGGWAEGTTGIGFDLDAEPAYLDHIQTDVGSVMKDENASIYVRIAFDVAPGTAGFLRLRMMYDSGFVAWLNGTEVASRNTTSAVRYNSRARFRRATEDVLTFEEVPILERGLLREGRNVLAIQALNDSSRSDNFLLVPEMELVRVESLEAENKYFTAPTPGRPNARGFDGVASPPVFSQPGGALIEPVTLELAAGDAGAVIRYTLDGSVPTESSAVYEAPFEVDSMTIVTARAFREDKVPSPPVAQSYVLLHTSAANFHSNLPIMIVDTFRRQPQADPYTHAFFATIDNEEGRNRVRGEFAQSGLAGIKLHGSSSLGFPKNNFRLETQDEFGEDMDHPLLGLPPESDWVLHGPYSDKSLMRNALAYRWSAEIGWFAPRTRFFELFINTRGDARVTSAHYWGVYLLVERIKRDEARVNIQRVLPSHDQEPEITGGYIFKNDRPDPGDSGFSTGRYTLRYVEPKERELTATQKIWIRDWFREFERALYGNEFSDPENGYEKYIDVRSWIDHHLMVELCKQIDGYRLSTFMFKKRSGKLYMGPVWDYNLSLGNANYLGGWQPAGWYYTQVGGNDYPWYARLFQDPEFVSRYRTRWLELRSGLLGTQRLHSTINETVDLLRESQARNFQKWRVLGSYVWPNWFIARTWDEEIAWMRDDWLVKRLDWMDGQLIPPPVLSHPGGPVERGFEVSISSPGGTIYYTLDGVDPQGTGGAPAASAQIYDAPIAVTKNIKVTARVRIDSGAWSNPVAATYVTDFIPIALTEIMYNPPDDPSGAFSSTKFEFVELQNTGDETVDLTGVRLTGRLRFDFTEGDVKTLGPREHVVVVQDREAFVSRYGTEGIKIAGDFAGIISNRGQTIEVLGPLDEPLIDVTYEDSWYPETDGEGYSLVLRDPMPPRSAWNEAASWRASLEVAGSPGRADGPITPAGLQLPGDLDQDGRLTVTDAVFVLRHLFRGTSNLPCESEEGRTTLLDINGDRSVNLTDAVHTLSYLFGEGAPPALGTDCVRVSGCEDACTE